jgi:hypothetical protein
MRRSHAAHRQSGTLKKSRTDSCARGFSGRERKGLFIATLVGYNPKAPSGSSVPLRSFAIKLAVSYIFTLGRAGGPPLAPCPLDASSSGR